MTEFYNRLTNKSLLTLYKEAVKNNTDYRWIKGEDSVGFTTAIRHIEEEILRRLSHAQKEGET